MALNPVQQPLEFKGRMTTLTVVRVLQSQLDLIEGQLRAQLEKVPGFFQGLPLLLELVDPSADLKSVAELMRRHGLTPVAVYGSSSGQESAAKAAGLGVLRDSRPQRETPQTTAAPEKPVAESPAIAVKTRPSTRIVTQPVRSGQQVYARDGDLVIMSSVGAGAEVLADGCIHIYGALRGRALAGVQGDTGARIFCQQMGAELVSVAGIYKVSEDIKDTVRGRSVQVYLDGEKLKIEKLSNKGTE